MSAVTLKVNGRTHKLDLDPSTPLLYALSDDLNLRGPKFGCGLGQCGACTVIVKGHAVRSCITPVKSVEGAEITTLAGIGNRRKASPYPAGVYRRASRPVRILPERDHPDRESLP